MGGASAPLTGPDFTQGIAFADLIDGASLLGHAHGEAVLLVRRGEEVFAVGATCSHYGGPLAEGAVVGDQVHCPWHHACFSLRTGEPHGPAFNPIACWKVERRGPLVVVGDKQTPHQKTMTGSGPVNVIIVGAGAAGHMAAEVLRREGYTGGVTLIGAESSVPVDRPNLSKDYLAGTAPEAWVPLRGPEFYAEAQIELLLGQPVKRIDVGAKRVTLDDGQSRTYGALLLATGASPVSLTIPGADLPHVFTLRSLADCRAIIEQAKKAKTAVVVGASFIGLEVAAALRTRGLEVHVVAPDQRPLERVLGPQLGDFIKALHEERGVHFHLRHTVKRIDETQVTLDDGSTLHGELVVAGIGVRPALTLAEQAGLKIDRGVLVNEFLETSAPGVFAAGDIARWADARQGASMRVEHWVVAQRQGEVAARNILGQRVPFADVPFFWSQHYDVPITYVGHAEGWDAIEVAGSVSDKNCLVAYKVQGRIAAVAGIYRDQDCLKAEQLLLKADQPGLTALMAQVT